MARSLLSGASERCQPFPLQGGQLLRQAAKNGQMMALTLLLERDEIDVDSRGENGRTALSLAAGKGHHLIVQKLLDTGKVDVNSKDSLKMRTPLLLAAAEGREEVVKLLLERRDVNLKATDFRGTPAWTLAKECGYREIADLITEKTNAARTPSAITGIRSGPSRPLYSMQQSEPVRSAIISGNEIRTPK